ncbi:cell wall protein [Microbacterium radiodurans]|uniref:Cell wall protein n=1 Tax=Microbacterium radiodurans TaxID=661398 RepID=A0A5J5ISJ2_9MICO|nr:cell wall protein [Microbacterium radiodurans]KAA9088957.1 cell wall protein [Microbacterium radiodurans]
MHRTPRRSVGRTTALAAAALGAAAIVAAGAALPAAASASTIYPPTNSCTTNPSTFTAGGTVAFGCTDGTFGPDEAVTITVRGENGAGVDFAVASFAVTTGSTVRQSTAAGALDDVTLTFPADAVGVYNIEAISASSAGGTASASVTTEAGLPATGGDARTALGLWVGGGALVAAGAVIAITTAVRRAQDARV